MNFCYSLAGFLSLWSPHAAPRIIFLTSKVQATLLNISNATFCDTAPTWFCKPALPLNLINAPYFSHGCSPIMLGGSILFRVFGFLFILFHLPALPSSSISAWLTLRGPSEVDKLSPSSTRLPTLSVSLNAFLGFS